MSLNYQEGLSDIDSALFIARTIKALQTENDLARFDHQMHDLIGLLINAKEHLMQTGPAFVGEQERSAAVSNSGRKSTSFSQLPSVCVTDEELEMLLG